MVTPGWLDGAAGRFALKKIEILSVSAAVDDETASDDRKIAWRDIAWHWIAWHKFAWPAEPIQEAHEV
jgi:hypothetical protein